MKMLITLLLTMLAFASSSLAQSTAPEQPKSELQRGERWRGKPLPPALQSELRQLRAKQGSRAIVFRDTVRASQLERRAFNDTTAEFDTSTVYQDSALSVIDSGVSLTHKEWLDSLLIEIPEFSRYADRVDFNYPQSIQTEPVKKAVTVASVDASRINPIPKENLPYFDQSPIPWTLVQGRQTSGYLTAGGGSLHLPLVRGGLARTMSDRLAFDLNGSYQKLSDVSAVRDHLAVNLLTTAELGLESAVEAYRATALEVLLQTTRKSTDLRSVADSNGDHSLSDLMLGARLSGNLAQPIYYDLSANVAGFTEQASAPSALEESETRYGAALQLTYDFGTSFRIRGDLATDAASELSELAPSNSLNISSARMLIGQRSWGSMEWFGGLKIVSGSDAGGDKTRLMPQALIRIPLNPRWEIGGSFEPSAMLASNYLLSSINPFYSRSLAVNFDSIDSRRVVLDRINFGGFMNYMLSADDQIRTEVQYIERDDEPVFQSRRADSSAGSPTVFVVDPRKTRRFIVSSSANFLMFKRDVITAGVEFRSATDRESEDALPFEPVLRVTGAYSFNSIAPYLRPIAEFHYLSREDKSISIINVGSDFLLSDRFTLNVQVDNLLNSQSDFWSGYTERPRSITGSMTYKFSLSSW